MTIETENEETQAQDEIAIPHEEFQKPALTVIFQSWTTPIIGTIMLAAGLFGGYYGRPLLSSDTTPVAVEESAPSDNGIAPETVPASDEDLAANQQELMAAVVENTRHFRGEPDAPVTIIEFSDFQ